jgi:hypothetical protein
MDWSFPQYRKLLDKSYYKIISTTEWIELQRLGCKVIETRFVVQHFADRNFLLDLLSGDKDRYEICSEEEFEKIKDSLKT